MVQTNTRTTSIFIIPIILLTVVGSVLCMGQNLKYTSHAKVSHREQISQIEKCFDSPESHITFYSLSNGRYGQYCQDGGRNGYWRILECRQTGEYLVVTQFKQALRKFSNYLTNHNMQELPGAPEC